MRISDWSSDVYSSDLAAKDDTGALCGFFGGAGGLTAKFLDPGLGLFKGSVVHGDCVTSLGQVPGHGKAHDAQAQECDLGGGLGFVGSVVDGRHTVVLR